MVGAGLKRVFIALPAFCRDWESYGLGENELRKLELYLLENLLSGDLIVGSNGIRKIRWARPGMGKSGGVRVFYFDSVRKSRLYFFAVIGKSDREDLTKREIGLLSEIVKSFDEEST